MFASASKATPSGKSDAASFADCDASVTLSVANVTSKEVGVLGIGRSVSFLHRRSWSRQTIDASTAFVVSRGAASMVRSLSDLRRGRKVAVAVSSSAAIRSSKEEVLPIIVTGPYNLYEVVHIDAVLREGDERRATLRPLWAEGFGAGNSITVSASDTPRLRVRENHWLLCVCFKVSPSVHLYTPAVPASFPPSVRCIKSTF